MWNYYWGMTAAQIELAIADGPVIVYKHDKKGKDGKVKPSGAAVERAALEWEREHADGSSGRMVLNLGGE